MGVCCARLAAAAVEASFAKALNRIEGLNLHDEPRKHWPSSRFAQLCMASRSLPPGAAALLFPKVAVGPPAPPSPQRTSYSPRNSWIHVFIG